MNSDRWEKIERLFHSALGRDPGHREAYLDGACDGDKELRLEVEALLASHDGGESFLETPAGDLAAEVIAGRGGELKTGDTIRGRYEVEGLLGEGGMGAVYRARDAQLGRPVALKLLPPKYTEDPERVRRFEQEAQTTGALNHPNILAIYDIGTHDGAPFIVSELLEGETLKERIHGTALPTRKAIDYALQIARGLTAAHEKGVVHRDLKPENIFVTRAGHVKILDFGLAKLRPPQFTAGADTAAPTLQVNTTPGQVMGTVPYMSPEQVRGEGIDFRTDIFAFGAVLYEMLTGTSPFRRATAPDTLSAILKEEPPALESVNGSIPPALGHVVSHCLEKNKEDRFQTARDLRFNLETLSGVATSTSTSGTTAALPAPEQSKWRIWPLAAAAALLLAVGLAAFFVGRRSGVMVGEKMAKAVPPEYQRLTFRQGTIPSARFSPDGQTIIYSAVWEGGQPQIFLTRPESPESRPLGLEDALLLSVSSAGEMAILLHPSLPVTRAIGTLARVSMAGGAPREVLRDVRAADWSPDGKQLAVLRVAGDKLRIEYPIGNLLYETVGDIGNLHISPKGDSIGFVEKYNNLVVIDLAGKKRVLSDKFSTLQGFDWAPGGDEIWFAAAEVGLFSALYAIPVSGGEPRLMARATQPLVIHDVASDGRVLINSMFTRKGVMALPPGETKERDLSWLDWAHTGDISNDGKYVVFTEAGQGGGASLSIYIRKTDGSPAVRLGEGEAQALSPDGEWVLSLQVPSNQIMLLPVGAGESKPLTDGKLSCSWAGWFPDSKRAVVVCNQQGETRPPQAGGRSYMVSIEGGTPQPITPEGVAGVLVSPDGKLLIAGRNREHPSLYPVEGGEPRPIQGLADDDLPIRWGADGSYIYVRRYAPNSAKVEVFRLELATGRRQLWKEFVPDPTRLSRVIPIVMTPDGKSYAYTYVRHNADLYLVKGLK